MLTHMEIVGKEVCHPEVEQNNHQDSIGLQECLYKTVFWEKTRWVPATPAVNTQTELRKAWLCYRG